ncbi:MAG: LCP family protein [Clostridia bacterium]|nr:LCP family protein [Clostridia bacterium]
MRLKSPLRLAVAILILLMLIYVGLSGAISIITDKPMSLKFWNSDRIEDDKIQDILVAGTDAEGYRTDLILLCRYNMTDNSVTALQIPRDTRIEETTRNDKKINSSYSTPEREQTLCDEVEMLTGIRPERYVIVSFKAFRQLIDAIGGVEVDVPIRMFYNDPFQNLSIDLYPGKQVLNGRQSEMFMRFRYNDDGTGYPNGDIDRIAAQKKFYEAALDKLLSGGTILKVPKILGIITENVRTDFTGEDIMKYIGKIPSFKTENIKILTLPGEGAYADDGVSYFFHDENETKLLLDEYFFSMEKKSKVAERISSKNKFVKVKIVDATGIDNKQADVLKVVSDMLTDYKFKVVSTEKTDRIQDHSKLINHNNKNAAEIVKAVYGGVDIKEGIETFVKKEGEKVPDVTLVVGSDFMF